MLLCRLMSLNFGTSQRYIHSNLLNIHFKLNKSFVYSARPWQRTSPRYVVLGLVDTSHTPALGYMEVDQSRDAVTLLPIIQAHEAPGTVVYTDQWRAYYHVSNLPPVTSHHTVNHSVNFVDPVTGVHTQHMESYLNRMKLKLRSMKGCLAHQVPSYLMNLCGVSDMPPLERAVYSIMQHIANQYPV